MYDIAAAMDAAIRYAAESHPDSGYHGVRGDEPLGFDLPAGDGSVLAAHTPRKVAAMWLEDQGREGEAERVQWHDGPLVLHGGEVKRGRHTTKPAYDRYNDAIQHLQDHYPDWTPQHEIEAKYEADDEHPIPDDHERIHYLDGHGEPQITDDVHAADFGRELAHTLRSEHRDQHGDGEYDDTLELLLKRLQRAPAVEPIDD